MFEPLIGSWDVTEASEERMNVRCVRTFEKTLQGKYIQLKADWHLPKSVYEDVTLFGVNADKEICFWSFQSDGKNAQGKLADGTDIHPDAVCFEAQMPAGIARQVYWPAEDEGFHWVVQSKTKKGWNTIVEHHYQPLTNQ